MDADSCYRAVRSRDSRFDGCFYTAVTTTGIYCRPSCPALTPRRANVRFFPSAAGAQRGGFRACKRCRPDTTPGSPEWDVRHDLAGRALRLIDDGIVDRHGVPGLASRLGYSERQLGRTLLAELGAGPLALARARRAQTARVLLETTELPASDVAFAAGFASIRQFNETMRAVFAATPRELRSARREHGSSEPGVLQLRLPFRAPLAAEALVRFLAVHAVAGVESAEGLTYGRTLRLPHGAALIELTPRPEWVQASLRLSDHRDLSAAVARVRRLLDLDSDPLAIDAVLAEAPVLAPLARRRPGVRSPGSVDGFELVARTIVGQQVSLAGARSVLGRIVATYGEEVFDGWRLFPSAETLAVLGPAALPLPRSRGRAVVTLAQAVASGNLALDAGADWDATEAALLALPGIGPWTARYARMRLGDPDVLLDTDLVLRRLVERLGLHAEQCAPWRSYVSHHLWAQFLDMGTTDGKDQK